MSVTVGVDGGQSRIRMRVSGDPEAKSAPGVSHLEADPVTAVADAIASIWNHRDDHVTRLVAGLTTIPASPEQRLRLATQLSRATGADEVWLGGDHATSHAGALVGATGVVLSAGTGVACLAVDGRSGAYRSFDGAGYLVGDEGAGFWIGRHGIRAALAGEQGRGPRTSLTEVVAAQLGPLETLAIRLHSTSRAVDTIAQMAVSVLAEAAGGDGVADAIISDAVARLVNTASAGVRFLDPASDIAVALGGRLLLQNHPLGAAVTAGVSAAHPDARVFLAEGTSLDGACLLAEWDRPGPYGALVSVHQFAGNPLPSRSRPRI